MDMNSLINAVIPWLLTKGSKIVIILVLTFIALKIANIISERLISLLVKRRKDAESKKRSDTMISVVQNALKVVILVVTTMMILKEIGIAIAPILAAAGIVGLAVGFGAQNLVQDVISGFFILLEDQIRVGDVVQTAGKGGLVEKVNLRITILRDLAGNVHFIRNGTIDIVTNMTKEYSRYVFDIGVAYRENVDEVIEVIKDVDAELRKDPEYRQDILEPIEILGLD
jgi:small conductance mechanosensitive channel